MLTSVKLAAMIASICVIIPLVDTYAIVLTTKRQNITQKRQNIAQKTKDRTTRTH
jgi:hypothetical protein